MSSSNNSNKIDRFCKVCKHYLGIVDSVHKCGVKKPTDYTYKCEDTFTCEELCREWYCYYYEKKQENNTGG